MVVTTHVAQHLLYYKIKTISTIINQTIWLILTTSYISKVLSPYTVNNMQIKPWRIYNMISLSFKVSISRHMDGKMPRFTAMATS